jgi:alkylation response protein AidB-like acyl-CoA dehydrogenase
VNAFTFELKEILPRIARGEAFFCIGMSEPDEGEILRGIIARGLGLR